MNSASIRRTGYDRRRRSRLRSFVTMLQIMTLLFLGAFVGIMLGLFVSMSHSLPNITDFEAPEATLIYSSDGVLLGRVFREDRTNVPLKDIPKNLREATIAIEDSRFYEHSGIDFRGIARALWKNLRSRKLEEGASTITQQLARNVYLTQRKTFQRKIQEAVLAILIERNFNKDKILELYLNQVFYGSGAFGVQAASKVYFGKDVDQLDLSESALLAGLPQKPSGYSPHDHLESALGRRDVVLEHMRDLGYITPEQCAEAKSEEIRIVPRSRGRRAYKASHFVDYVTQKLRESYGDDVLFGGGLRVYTTLNYKMQQIAEQALRSGVHKHERVRHVSEGCFICIEPDNGYIRAMVGSVNPDSEYNRCTQAGRQPGSSFKAFVYTAALQSGMTPMTRVQDSRKSFPAGNGKWWRPRNYDGKYRGSVTMKTAVALSLNLAAINTADKVGVKNVIKYAQAMGIHSKLEPYLPIAIGGVPGVHPIEMASAYCTFANDGVHVEPIAITRVTNSRGEVIEDYTPEGVTVIPKKTNRMMDEMFREVVTRGTGKPVRDVPEARGKTGTTNDDRDAWWIGYIPHKLAAAVWVGNDNYAPMNHAWGGTVCAPIWRDFMLKAIPIYNKIRTEAQAHIDKPKDNNQAKPDREKLNKPDAIDNGNNNTGDTNTDTQNGDEIVSRKICNETGLLATRRCPSWHTEKFVKGTEPTSYCNVHTGEGIDKIDEPNNTRTNSTKERKASSDKDMVTVTICSESGMLAGPNCPAVRKRLPIDEVPTQVCNIHNHTRE